MSLIRFPGISLILDSHWLNTYYPTRIIFYMKCKEDRRAGTPRHTSSNRSKTARADAEYCKFTARANHALSTVIQLLVTPRVPRPQDLKT